MKVLGIETATAVCSAGIIDGEDFRGEVSLKVPFLHAEWIFPRIDELLTDCGLRATELGAVAVSTGPGSFTGLRVGLSAAKGIAIAADCPLIGVETLEVLAQQAPPTDRKVWAVLPSIRDEYFAGVFTDGGGAAVRIRDDMLLSRDGLLASVDNDSLIIGLIPSGLRSEATARFRGIQVISSASLFRGTEVAFAGNRKIQQGESSDIAALEPRYLRSFPDRKKA